MILADFLKAAVPDPVTCLGVRLRPLSLGSLILLQRFDNAYLTGKVPRGTFGDLLQGVLVCSLPFADAQAALSDPDLSRDLARWGWKLQGGWLRWTKKRRLAFSLRVARAGLIFQQHLDAGLKYPFTKVERGPEKEIGSPWVMFTLTALMEDLKQPKNEALDQPLAFSRWLVAANGERKGQLEVVEREGEGGLDALQKEADAIAAEVFAAERSNGLPQ